MDVLNTPVSYSSFFLKDREMYPRIPVTPKPAQITPKLQEKTIEKPPIGPGIFFDMSKSQQQQQQSMRKTSNKTLSQFSQKSSLSSHKQTLQERSGQHAQGKLYSPYEYLHYATKVNSSKESYLNSLSQLGFKNVQTLNDQPYNDIVNKTSSALQNSYSLKYLGVIDGNMGILSKRLKISDRLALREQQKQTKILSKNNNNNQNTSHSQFSLEPSSAAQPADFYNCHLITSYSLPKYLRPIIKSKDEQAEEEKRKLEQWHADSLKSTSTLFKDQSAGNNPQVTQNINAEHDQKSSYKGIHHNKDKLDQYEQQVNEAVTAGILNSGGLFTQRIKPKRFFQMGSQGNTSSSQDVSTQQQSQQQQTNGFQSKNDNPDNLGKSYSRLLNTMDQKTTAVYDRTIPSKHNKSTILPTTSEKQTSSITHYKTFRKTSNSSFFEGNLSQNELLLSRYDHIAKLVQDKQSGKMQPYISN